MSERGVVDWLGEPEAVVPSRLGMTSTTWMCSKCKTLHEFDLPVKPPSPCLCGSIFFEKKARVLQ